MKCIEEQGNAVLAIHFRVKAVDQLYITNKTECFSFKSGRVVQVAKFIKEDWPIAVITVRILA